MFEDLWSWVVSFLANLVAWAQQLIPTISVFGLQLNAIPITLLIVGSILLAYCSWTLVKNATLSVTIIVALVVVCVLLRDLQNWRIGYGLTGLDLAIVTVIVLSTWVFSKLRAQPQR